MRVVIGFSTGTNPVSALIRWMTRSTASHAWFLVYDPLFRIPQVWEAGLYGYRPTHASRFWRKHRVLATYALDVPQESLAVAGQWLGEAYDVAGLLGAVVPLVGRWFRKKWSNPFHGATALFCSEAVARLLQTVPALNFQMTPDDVSPQDLVDFLATSGAAKVTSPATPEHALELP